MALPLEREETHFPRLRLFRKASIAPDQGLSFISSSRWSIVKAYGGSGSRCPGCSKVGGGRGVNISKSW